MQTRPVRLLGWLAVIGAMVVAVAGCPEDAADIVATKAVSLDFDVAPLAVVDFAGGDLTIDRSILAAIRN